MGHPEYIKQILQENILQYWLKLKDPAGGFYGEVSASGEVIEDAPRGVILNARIIWAFAAAYRALGKQEYLEAAQWAKDWFLKHFCDHKYGGVYWSVSAEGERLEDKKQLYSQGFAIYGLSELVRACGDEEALKEAVNLFKVVEAKFADTLYGGYTEALARDFSPLEDMSLSAHDINADKTMNSHLHILEAYANLYRVWPDPALKAAVERLLDITCEKVMAADGHLKLYFRNDWSVLPGAVSFGHDIETSWLMLECAEALDDESVVSRVKPYALRLGLAGNEGILPDGSMRYEKLPDGSFDDSRQWWVQAETVVGNLWLWKYHGVTSGYDTALKAWDYILKNLVDREGGEWWWAVLPDGSIDRANPKAGFWKCPYHNSRMCLEALRILD
ncbi:MAG: AGE family epimerase/isomerase [Bacteroidales bacterium]|nr:AGE family epimerase/isomerase [Bacteroidales bacterium]